MNYLVNHCLTSAGYLLSGQKLDDARLGVLITLQQNSLIPDPIIPRQRTPPPSPSQPPPSVPGEPTVSTTNDPWSISAEDLSLPSPQPSQPIMDKGMLFQIWCTLLIKISRYHWLVLRRWLFSLCMLSCVLQCQPWLQLWLPWHMCCPLNLPRPILITQW